MSGVKTGCDGRLRNRFGCPKYAIRQEITGRMVLDTTNWLFRSGLMLIAEPHESGSEHLARPA